MQSWDYWSLHVPLSDLAKTFSDTTSNPTTQNPWFIILEDDAKIIPGFHENLARVFDDLRKWPIEIHNFPEIIHLACMDVCNAFPVMDNLYSLQVFATTRAYAISLSGARKLAASMTNITYHVDIMISIRHALQDIKLAIYCFLFTLGTPKRCLLAL